MSADFTCQTVSLEVIINCSAGYWFVDIGLSGNVFCLMFSMIGTLPVLFSEGAEPGISIGPVTAENADSDIREGKKPCFQFFN